MANKTKNDPEIDVILVVKGGGDQEPDGHLHKFLNGFWPAVTSLYPHSTIKQKNEEDDFDEFNPTPHDKNSHKHFTEINVNVKTKTPSGFGLKTIQKILVKESYWEPEIIPTTPGSAIRTEWRMASYAFRSLLIDPGRDPDDLKTNSIKYMSQYSFLFLFVLIPLISILLNHLPESFNIVWYYKALFGAILALLFGIGAGYENSKFIEYRNEIRNNQGKDFLEPLKSLPAFPGWILSALMVVLLAYWKEYFLWLGLVGLIGIFLLIARGLLYKNRTDVYSDTYNKYPVKNKHGKWVGKERDGISKYLLKPWVYRYFVFLLQPIFFLGWSLIWLLNSWSVTRKNAARVEKLVRKLLTGYLSDVVDYAMNPAYAQRVRSAILTDIEFFCSNSKVKVTADRIHIFAHSQGTPITYETLFHYLDKTYWNKIYTYITIGNVLSYYHHARGVLDPIYHRRFPVDQDLTPHFPENFLWMNFWNLADFIAEFYALDEFVIYEDDGSKRPIRPKTSPKSIKTRLSSKNHDEYWSNLEEIHIPFVKRLISLGGNGNVVMPEEWKPKIKVTPNNRFIELVFVFSSVFITLVDKIKSIMGNTRLFNQPEKKKSKHSEYPNPHHTSIIILWFSITTVFFMFIKPIYSWFVNLIISLGSIQGIQEFINYLNIRVIVNKVGEMIANIRGTGNPGVSVRATTRKFLEEDATLDDLKNTILTVLGDDSSSILTKINMLISDTLPVVWDIYKDNIILLLFIILGVFALIGLIFQIKRAFYIDKDESSAKNYRIDIDDEGLLSETPFESKEKSSKMDDNGDIGKISYSINGIKLENVGDDDKHMVRAREKWNDTGIILEVGKTYLITAKGEWYDAGKPADPDGILKGKLTWFHRLRIVKWFRRAPQSNWFALIGAINFDESTSFEIGKENISYSPKTTGVLTCYANDLPGFYWNNSGEIKLTVRRIKNKKKKKKGKKE